MFEKKLITGNAFLTEMKSRPREHARKEGFESISSDALSICHKTPSKLFLANCYRYFTSSTLVQSFALIMCFLFLWKVV